MAYGVWQTMEWELCVTPNVIDPDMQKRTPSTAPTLAGKTEIWLITPHNFPLLHSIHSPNSLKYRNNAGEEKGMPPRRDAAYEASFPCRKGFPAACQQMRAAQLSKR